MTEFTLKSSIESKDVYELLKFEATSFYFNMIWIIIIWRERNFLEICSHNYPALTMPGMPTIQATVNTNELLSWLL